MSEVDVEALDVQFNLTLASMQLKNEKLTWRGEREKNSKSMQILLESLATPRFVVLYAYTSTC